MNDLTKVIRPNVDGIFPKVAPGRFHLALGNGTMFLVELSDTADGILCGLNLGGGRYMSGAIHNKNHPDGPIVRLPGQREMLDWDRANFKAFLLAQVGKITAATVKAVFCDQPVEAAGN